jgi:hypothetical protein
MYHLSIAQRYCMQLVQFWNCSCKIYPYYRVVYIEEDNNLPSCEVFPGTNSHILGVCEREREGERERERCVEGMNEYRYPIRKARVEKIGTRHTNNILYGIS